MEELLKTHKPEPLSPGEEDAIERILKAARDYYRKEGLISDKEWDTYKQDLKSPSYPYG
jgi:hypothetical protein